MSCPHMASPTTPAMTLEPGPGFALAMAYVPRQQWGQLYDERTALERGTIFPELDMPFLAAGHHCNKGGACK